MSCPSIRLLVEAGMKIPAFLCALLPALAFADGPVEVKFGDLAKFTDLRVSISTNDRDRQGLADELRRHIERVAPARLPADQKLSVLITDVDMAGEYPPITGGFSRDIRVIKDVYPPRIDLDFKLVRADGSVEREGHRQLRDAGFMWSTSPVTREQLAFEKALLDAWLQKEFPSAR
jgi:hypothetical protein